MCKRMYTKEIVEFGKVINRYLQNCFLIRIRYLFVLPSKEKLIPENPM